MRSEIWDICKKCKEFHEGVFCSCENEIKNIDWVWPILERKQLNINLCEKGQGAKVNREILTSLHKVNEEIGAISKDQIAPISKDGRHYKFRGIEQVLNALAPLFKKYGVLVSRRNLEAERIIRTVQGKYGPKDYVETSIKRCDYVFTSTKDGSEFISQGFGEGQDSSGGDKSASMATSNSYKYVIFEMFSIATEEQKDSDQMMTVQAQEEQTKKDKKKNNSGYFPGIVFQVKRLINGQPQIKDWIVEEYGSSQYIQNLPSEKQKDIYEGLCELTQEWILEQISPPELLEDNSEYGGTNFTENKNPIGVQVPQPEIPFGQS